MSWHNDMRYIMAALLSVICSISYLQFLVDNKLVMTHETSSHAQVSGKDHKSELTTIKNCNPGNACERGYFESCVIKYVGSIIIALYTA